MTLPLAFRFVFNTSRIGTLLSRFILHNASWRPVGATDRSIYERRKSGRFCCRKLLRRRFAKINRSMTFLSSSVSGAKIVFRVQEELADVLLNLDHFLIFRHDLIIEAELLQYPFLRFPVQGTLTF